MGWGLDWKVRPRVTAPRPNLWLKSSELSNARVGELRFSHCGWDRSRETVPLGWVGTTAGLVARKEK